LSALSWLLVGVVTLLWAAMFGAIAYRARVTAARR
jgi:hypothetical protein